MKKLYKYKLIFVVASYGNSQTSLVADNMDEFIKKLRTNYYFCYQMNSLDKSKAIYLYVYNNDKSTKSIEQHKYAHDYFINQLIKGEK